MSDEEHQITKPEAVMTRMAVSDPIPPDPIPLYESNNTPRRDSPQGGVRTIEGISLSWTGKALAIAYIGYVQQMFASLQPYQLLMLGFPANIV